ncbi:Maf family protein [Candidatus Saccharibacteria bacterium]|nr:Maf family protein [Candidatus Saccharibacteria bacterium]
MKIILASQSKVRKQFLLDAGLEFDVIVSDVDETPDESKNFRDQLAEIAMRKAKAVLERTKDQGRRLILAGDQNIIFENQSWGKPKTIEEGRSLVGRMRGASDIYAYTGNAFVLADGDQILQCTNLTDTAKLRVDNISDAELDAYLAKGSYKTYCGGICVTDGGFVHLAEGRESTVHGITIEYALEMLKNES